jgi:AbrB family looped-hinge helix DNA binding protein
MQDINSKLPNNKLEGKYMSSVKVGAKGQIVIPKEARELFNIKPGDTLILLADVERGIAIQRYELFKKFSDELFGAKDNAIETDD